MSIEKLKILLTGASGYIGKRLLTRLLDEGHHVICCVRDKNRFNIDHIEKREQISILEIDFLKDDNLIEVNQDIDVAYYLIHSMSSSDDFEVMENKAALNFKKCLEKTNVKQVIYLGGIGNQKELSKHLTSRKKVGEVLLSSSFPVTILNAGIIIGSGSASFEIMRDLVEKLPFMITPKWLNTKSQPIAVANVLDYLVGVILKSDTYEKSFDVGGPDILTYKEMLLALAKIRGLRRYIITLPVLTPKLSSYWLYFVTSITFKLAQNLVNSLKVEVICEKNALREIVPIELTSYSKALELAFYRTQNNTVDSKWTDALSSQTLSEGIDKYLEVPSFGCFKDCKKNKITDENATIQNIWSLGGKTGWYHANFLWSLRGFIDKIFGGVGLRRGRRNASELLEGDSLDFWRVLYCDKKEKRLLLFAEMKLPGEAWLEFIIKDGILYQTATFRPLGVLGRLYWYSVLPLHYYVFSGMIKKLSTS